MRPTRFLPVLICAGLLGLAAAGCGTQPAPTGLARAQAGMTAHAGPPEWDEEIVLEDFETGVNDYYRFGPYMHPFLYPITVTWPVHAAAAGSSVMELLSPRRLKPAKGGRITQDVYIDGQLVREDCKPARKVMAEQVQVSWRWGNNGAQTRDPAIFAQVAFVYTVANEKKPRALGYAWTNNGYCQDYVIDGQLGNTEDSVPMRTIVLTRGPGEQPQPCSATALNQIKLTTVSRNFIADAEWAWSPQAPIQQPGMNMGRTTDGECPPATSTPPPPNEFTNPATGKPAPNTRITGVAALAFAAEIPANVCSHAIVDDVVIRKKWPICTPR